MRTCQFSDTGHPTLLCPMQAQGVAERAVCLSVPSTHPVRLSTSIRRGSCRLAPGPSTVKKVCLARCVLHPAPCLADVERRSTARCDLAGAWHHRRPRSFRSSCEASSLGVTCATVSQALSAGRLAYGPSVLWCTPQREAKPLRGACGAGRGSLQRLAATATSRFLTSPAKRNTRSAPSITCLGNAVQVAEDKAAFLYAVHRTHTLTG